jgi:phosphoserine phosphatase RsbU/P
MTKDEIAKMEDGTIPISSGAPHMSAEPALTQHKVTVLLIDDQPMIGEAVRRMLAGEPDLDFHYCRDAAKALDEAHRVNPTVILQDLVMPDIDGLTLVKTFRANDATRETPMIVLSTKEEPTVKAEAFALGANDYIVKLPDRLELLARIRYHSKGYINLLQRNEAYDALLESQRRLASEINQAAHYVRSLLPEKLKKGDVRTDWRFVPSAELGGDSFGYHWLDDDHFAIFLLDVSGHGVGSALLSVSAMNALRSQALPQTDFRRPDQVLAALNNAFQMDQQNGLFFTIWYGVYHKPSRRIDYSGGGHPPGLLMNGPSSDKAVLAVLESHGPMIGAVPDLPYQSGSVDLDAFAKLYLYSDGAYEISRVDQTMWPFEQFIEFMKQGPHDTEGGTMMDRLIAHDRMLQGRDEFVDDFSIVEFRFGG